jgi:predicted nucleic acid-binding protein
VPTKVVDASAVAAMLFHEPEAAAVAQQLDGCQLVAPPLLEFELGNVCLTKLRRHPDRRGALLESFRWRSRLAVAIRSIDDEGVLVLAEQSQLSFYDASYLWLARELDAMLVTLDRRLAEASRRIS